MQIFKEYEEKICNGEKLGDEIRQCLRTIAK